MIDIHLQMKKTDEAQKKSPVELNTMNFLEQVFFVFRFLLFHFFCFPSTKDIRRENQSDLQSDSHLLWKSNFNLNVKSLETFRLKIYLILFWSSNVKSLKHFPRSMVYLLNFNWKLKRWKLKTFTKKIYLISIFLSTHSWLVSVTILSLESRFLFIIKIFLYCNIRIKR